MLLDSTTLLIGFSIGWITRDIPSSMTKEIFSGIRGQISQTEG